MTGKYGLKRFTVIKSEKTIYIVTYTFSSKFYSFKGYIISHETILLADLIGYDASIYHFAKYIVSDHYF